jgi:hypothetical protein
MPSTSTEPNLALVSLNIDEIMKKMDHNPPTAQRNTKKRKLSEREESSKPVEMVAKGHEKTDLKKGTRQNSIYIDSPQQSTNKVYSLKDQSVPTGKKRQKRKKSRTGSTVPETSDQSERQQENEDSRPPLLLSNTTKFQQKLVSKLSGSRFRFINEQLYTTTGSQAKMMMEKDSSMFNEVSLMST